MLGRGWATARLTTFYFSTYKDDLVMATGTRKTKKKRAAQPKPAAKKKKKAVVVKAAPKKKTKDVKPPKPQKPDLRAAVALEEIAEALHVMVDSAHRFFDRLEERWELEEIGDLEEAAAGLSAEAPLHKGALDDDADILEGEEVIDEDGETETDNA